MLFAMRKICEICFLISGALAVFYWSEHLATMGTVSFIFQIAAKFQMFIFPVAWWFSFHYLRFGRQWKALIVLPLLDLLLTFVLTFLVQIGSFADSFLGCNGDFAR